MGKLYKFALCEAVSVDINEGYSKLTKTASGQVLIEPDSDKAMVLEAEIKKHPNALFFRAKAIEADAANNNGDYFSSEELVKAHKSFEGVPFFTNHDNQNVENARGKIIHAEWVPQEKAVYTIAFIDRDAFPSLCRSIEEEYTSGVSMGCTVEYSECNICGNKAERTEDYCTHIRNRKGRNFTGTAKDVKTGEIKQFKNEPVFEFNYGIKFIELSAVVDPACPTCHIDGIVPNDNYLKRVASMQNELYMIKSSAIEKQASQEDIEKLNEVLQTLEDISINLIKNRQQVETEFASDLVDILSNLQAFVDELVGGGYGSIPGVGDNPVDGAPQEGLEGEVPPADMPAEGVPQEGAPTEAPAPQAMGAQSPAGAGTVSGVSPSAPVAPQFPITSPVKPMGADFNVNKINRISDFVKAASDVRNRIVAFNNVGEDNMAGRRTVSAKKQQKEKAIEVLSNSWKEKQEFFEYITKVPLLQDNENKLSIERQDDTFVIVASSKDDNENGKQVWTYEDLTSGERQLVAENPHDAALHFLKSYANSLPKNSKKGVEIMTTDIREAGANSVNKTPEVVTEAQLEEKGLYHSRTEEEKNEVTQAQLESERKGEKDYLTEVQLDDSEVKLHPRKGEGPEVVTQAQLEDDSSGVSPRKNDEWNEVTQSQLDSHGNRTGTEPEQITERQLDALEAPWKRAAKRDSSLFKSAGEHMQATITVMADSAIATGATPEEMISASKKLVASTEDRYNLFGQLVDTKAVRKEAISFANRLAYWNGRKVKLAGASSNEIKELIVSGLQAVAHDETINPETIVDAVDVLAEMAESAKSISDAIDAKLEASSQEDIKQTSVKDELRQALVGVDTKEARSKERKEILASLKKDNGGGVWKETVASAQRGGADTVIEGNFSELGCRYAKGENDKEFRQAVKKFASESLLTENMKLASIINVTIKDETVQIAVKTDEGEESVEIPVGEGPPMEPADGEMVPEGDIAGEGLENALPAPTPAPAQGMGMMSGAYAKSANKMTKKAQFGGGTGGGVPGTPGDVAAPGAPEGGLPMNDPAGDAVQNLTTDEDDMDEIPTAGEKQLPWCICPECGTDNVDVEDEEGDIHGTCQECGCSFSALMKKTIEFVIENPSEGNAGEGALEPETPEVPAVPVAAETKLDKAGFLRMASNYQKRGHVCPACGMNHCKASVEGTGHSKYTCPACGTGVTKDVYVNPENTEESVMRIAWLASPSKDQCDNCEEKAAVFASRIKIGDMIRTAQNNGNSPFPMANCLERVARKWGGNSTASYGPCKGKPLAECVCGQLSQLALTKTRHLEKLASVYMQPDPWDECLNDKQKEGFSIKEAETICGCLKKTFASEADQNPFIQALSEDIDSGVEKVLTAQDLTTLNDILSLSIESKQEIEEEVDTIDDSDIGDDLPVGVVKEEVVEASETPDEVVETISIDIVAQELVEATADALDKGEAKAGEEAIEEVKEAQTAEEVKEAQAVCVCTYCNVEAVTNQAGQKVCGNTNCTHYGKACDVLSGDFPAAPDANPMFTASDDDEVKEASETDTEKEKELAMAMQTHRLRRAGNDVITLDTSILEKVAAQPKKVEDIEPNVEAGVPRSKATIGNEGASNIDVPMAKPSVPRAEATMGHEGPDNINPAAGLPDVAVDSSYMGVEKGIQSNMPPINNEIKGTVIAEGEKTQKTAAQPKKVEDIEPNVEAGVPRSKATIGNEGASNIDVPMAKPSVPRAEATMGHEGPDNINPAAGLPDVAVDSSYMGVEKGIQSNMPPINNEIKGTVIAENDEVIVIAEDAVPTKTAKKLKEVETVEGDVEAGVPRADATIGNEGADNIDVPMAKPSVPRSKATMGNEGADNIDVPSPAPDVPVDSAYMGDEKNVQKDMPGINDEMLKNVAKREQQKTRIAEARRLEAIQVASKLLATKRIEQGAYNSVVRALSSFGIDEIAKEAEVMYPVKKVASKEPTRQTVQGHTIPAIVLESKELVEHVDPTDAISGLFTIGDKSLTSMLNEQDQK